MICIGIGMMFLKKAEAAYIMAGSGALSEFVAATFFYLYNKTIVKTGEYHQKLVVTQNISLALKITEELPAERKADAQIMIIQALVKDVNALLSNQTPTPSVEAKPTTTPAAFAPAATGTSTTPPGPHTESKTA